MFASVIVFVAFNLFSRCFVVYKKLISFVLKEGSALFDVIKLRVREGALTEETRRKDIVIGENW